MTRRHYHQPVVLTLEETDRRKITDRLKIPLLAVAIAFNERRLRLWLERQELVEAWQFIELPPRALMARSDQCGRKKIDEINAVLLRLELPPVGVQFSDELVKRRLGRRNEYHLYEDRLAEHAGNPKLRSLYRSMDERALISMMRREQDNYLLEWSAVMNSDGRARYGRLIAIDRTIRQIVQTYFTTFVATPTC